MTIPRKSEENPVIKIDNPNVIIKHLHIDSAEGVGIEYTEKAKNGGDFGNLITAKKGIKDSGEGNFHSTNVINASTSQSKKHPKLFSTFLYSIIGTIVAGMIVVIIEHWWY